MSFQNAIQQLPKEKQLTTQPRPYINHSVEFKTPHTAEERAKKLQEVGLNVFSFPSEMLTGCDFLSDSGTTTMTNEQWAALHLGDEAYGSNKGYFILMDEIKKTFGEQFVNYDIQQPTVFLFHQGRAAEDALFSMLSKINPHFSILSNGHFDTTQANIEANSMEAINLFSPELKAGNPNHHFKGDMDVQRLKEHLAKNKDHIPLIFLTITNNTGGGQPVSMENIKEVSHIAHQYGIPLFFDACRFAENAYFIKKYGSENAKSIPQIILEMFSYVDGFTISFKKDGLCNMGGGLILNKKGLFIKKFPQLPDALTNHQITTEGHPTYGGLSGRDIMALAYGLRTIVKEEYLTHRVEQVRIFGEAMHNAGIPVVMPIGGHAVYLDINKFFEGTSMKPEDFGGIGLTAMLLALYGHRACELGNFAFGAYENGKHKFPEVNYVRFAVPRLRYEEQDLRSVVEAVKALHDHREIIKPVDVTYGIDLPLRHFKAKFEFRE